MGHARGIALLAVVLSLTALAAPAAELDDLLAGLQILPLGDQPAPPFRLEALSGPPVALGDLRGRAVLLYFWESG